MYNMVQNGNFTDGFRGWTIHGFPHEMQRIKTIRRSFNQIPVSSAISQMITVNRNASYVLQFKINSTSREMFCIRVKEWITNPEGTTSTGHVYEFDHYDSQHQLLTTGPHTDRLEITIENTGQSPFTLSSIEITPAQHIVSETYSQQASKPSHERDNNHQMNPSHVESLSFLHTYLDLSAVQGLNSSQMVEQTRNVFARLIRYIPKEPLQRVLRWMNQNGAIQVVPMDYDSSDALVSFQEPYKQIIIKIQHKNDLDTIDFIENVLYGLGLALDVYAGNFASDHPEFQQLIQQEKERYREATGYVFTGNYHDIFAQVFTSLYSPYEEVRQKIVRVVPHTSHYIQRLFESRTPSVSQISKELNMFESMDHLTAKPYMDGNHSFYSTPRVGPEKPEEKPEELYDRYKKEIFDRYGHDLERITDAKERDIVAKHIVEQHYNDWHKAMPSNYQVTLAPMITEHDAVKNMTEFNAALKGSQGDPRFINRDEVKDLVAKMDTAIRLPKAKLEKDTILYVDAPEFFRYRTLYSNAEGSLGEVHDYMMGTLTLPQHAGNSKATFIKLSLPKGTAVGAINGSLNMFIDRQQGLRLYEQHKQTINGIGAWIVRGELTDTARVKDFVDITKTAFQIKLDQQCSNVIENSVVDPILKISSNTTFMNTDEMKGLYADLKLQTDMTVGNLGNAIFSKIPVNAMIDTISKLDTENGIFTLSDQDPSFWEEPSSLFGYLSPYTNKIKVYANPEITLSDQAHIMRTQLGYAIDVYTLCYTASGPNDANVPSLSQSESFSSIFRLDAEKFKPLGGKGPAKTPEEYFAAVFASMHSTDLKEVERVNREAENAVRFIQIKLDVANKVLDENSSSKEWLDFAEYIGMKIPPRDRLQYLFENNLLESELHEINNALILVDGDVTKLPELQQEVIRGLQERFDTCPPIPHQVVMGSDTPPTDYVSDSFVEQDGVTKADAGTKVDGEPIYNIAEQTRNVITGIEKELRNRIVVPLSNTALAQIDREKMRFTLKNGTIYDLAKTADNYLTALLVSDKQISIKADKKEAKFNSNVFPKGANINPFLKTDLIDTSELTKSTQKTTAVDAMRTIMSRLQEKTLPAPVLKMLVNSLPKNCFKITEQKIDEQLVPPRKMPDPFKADYIEKDRVIVLQRFRNSQKSKFSIRDFTNDLVYALGVPLYQSSQFGDMAKEQDFLGVLEKDGVNLRTLQELAGKNIDERFSQKPEQQFAFILSYLYNTDAQARKKVGTMFPNVCHVIESILDKMGRNLSYLVTIQFS